MTIAIFSDLHDNIKNWEKILEIIKEKNCEQLIFCGDMCAPITMAHVAKTFGKPMHCVLGNVDGDPYLMMERARDLPNLKIYGRVAELEIDGIKVHVNHYPDFARCVAETGNYNLVCYGHNHIKNIEKVNKTILLNPGTAGGIFQPASFAIFNTTTNTIDGIDL